HASGVSPLSSSRAPRPPAPPAPSCPAPPADAWQRTHASALLSDTHTHTHTHARTHARTHAQTEHSRYSSQFQNSLNYIHKKLWLKEEMANSLQWIPSLYTTNM